MRDVPLADRPLRQALLAAILVAALPASQVTAAERDELQQVERQLEADRERAAALERQQREASAMLARLRREAIAAAKKAQDHEARLIEMEATLKDLARREDTARAALRKRNREMSGTLAALERISRNPPQTMLAFPGAPTRMVRSAMLLRSALPRLREDADDLAAELDALDRIRQETRVRLAALEDETAALEKERERLSGVLDRKAALLKETESERREVGRRVQELAKRAKSIRDLLAQIEAERQRREREEQERKRREAAARAQSGQQGTVGQSARDVALAKPDGVRPFPNDGPITLPTSATLIRRYGERNLLGQTERGLTFATRSGAQIVAPHDGLVVFAGPFEGYGQILIIEHDGGYHTLLAGLGRLDTSVGQWILAGEPVGAAGGIVDASGERQGLYLELRRKGQPINPWRWVAGAIQNRTSG